MTLPEILVIRHGETEWNKIGRIQGGLDSPLTEKGMQQAQNIGKLLQQTGVNATSHDFLTSPQGRARHTAELALAPIGASARLDPNLGEIQMGEWAGLTRKAIDAGWPSDDPQESFLEFYRRVPGGESFDVLWGRVGEVLANLSRPTVLVTHGVTSRFLRAQAMGYGLDGLENVPGGQGVINRVRDGAHDTIKM